MKYRKTRINNQDLAEIITQACVKAQIILIETAKRCHLPKEVVNFLERQKATNAAVYATMVYNALNGESEEENFNNTNKSSKSLNIAYLKSPLTPHPLATKR
mgnify:CR=1 FL=1